MRFSTCLLIFSFFLGVSQKGEKYQVRTIAFYNVENLFDVHNDSLIFDDERTPQGRYAWTVERYQTKIARIAEVLSKLGTDKTGSSPDIIGLCEVENKSVLQDLVSHPHLKTKDYGIIHFNSPDERGIDVALLYKKAVFIPSSMKSQRLLLFNEEGFRDYTRDQLIVGGLLDNEQLYFLVNHWPSRSGGEHRSRPYRIKAAQQNKRVIDSLQAFEPHAKIISMGDFNDDPIDDTFKKVLKTVGNPNKLDSTQLFNPMEKWFRKGVGTLAYRDRWNLFDQFVLSPNFVDATDRKYYSYWKAGIYNPNYLKNPAGKYKGYPFRTYVGTTYYGGYADHFPIYMYLIRKAEN